MADSTRKPGSGAGGGKSGRGGSTQAVHGGERDHHEDHALATPIHQTSTFWFDDSAQLREYAEGRLVRDEYAPRPSARKQRTFMSIGDV